MAGAFFYLDEVVSLFYNIISRPGYLLSLTFRSSFDKRPLDVGRWNRQWSEPFFSSSIATRLHSLKSFRKKCTKCFLSSLFKWLCHFYSKGSFPKPSGTLDGYFPTNCSSWQTRSQSPGTISQGSFAFLWMWEHGSERSWNSFCAFPPGIMQGKKVPLEVLVSLKVLWQRATSNDFKGSNKVKKCSRSRSFQRWLDCDHKCVYVSECISSVAVKCWLALRSTVRVTIAERAPDSESTNSSTTFHRPSSLPPHVQSRPNQGLSTLDFRASSLKSKLCSRDETKWSRGNKGTKKKEGSRNPIGIAISFVGEKGPFLDKYKFTRPHCRSNEQQQLNRTACVCAWLFPWRSWVPHPGWCISRPRPPESRPHRQVPVWPHVRWYI